MEAFDEDAGCARVHSATASRYVAKLANVFVGWVVVF